MLEPVCKEDKQAAARSTLLAQTRVYRSLRFKLAVLCALGFMLCVEALVQTNS